MRPAMERTAWQLALLMLVIAVESCSANDTKTVLSTLFGGHLDHEEKIFDDVAHYVKPGASPSELLEARGYLAREFHFTTPDNYSISITRGRNPLINDGQSGYKSKLPILFIHGATVTAGSYLLNSAGVRPRVYEESLDLVHMDVPQLHQLVSEDPARKALPFLAMNFGYEVWILERRGYAGSRIKLGHENRTVGDAFKSIPETLIGNAMDGFSLDANMAFTRPKRARFARGFPNTRNTRNIRNTRDTRDTRDTRNISRRQLQSAPELSNGSHFSEADFRRADLERHPLKGFKPKTKTGRIIKRILNKSIQMRKRLGPLNYPNMLQAFMALAKLPSTFAQLVGNITHDFVQTFDPDFWRFSLDEQALYDYPGAVDFVLEQTGAPKVHTLGLSCGGAVILLALAEQPQLAEKISRAVLWAPSVNMGSHTDIVYLLGYIIPMVQGYVGPVPFTFITPIIEVLLQTLCATDFMQRTVCTAAVDAIMGHSGSEAPMRPYMLGNLLQPTSSGELFQLGQFARTQFPCKFNMNTKEENLRRYNSEKPPCYHLSNITLRDISFYGGTKDRLVSPDDIVTTVRQMRVPTEVNIIKSPYNFNHLGCFLHRDADKLILLPSLLDMERSQAAERQHAPHSHHGGHQEDYHGQHENDLHEPSKSRSMHMLHEEAEEIHQDEEVISYSSNSLQDDIESLDISSEF